MTYRVTYSKAYEQVREIGRFDALEDAVTAAAHAGALYDGNSIRALGHGRAKDACLSVRGHEDSDDHAIWIERA